MSERKGDEMMVTGAHRAWTGEASAPIAPIAHASPVRDPRRNWLDRTQAPANPRHAAITRSLYSWSSYKSWTDKVRNSWDKDKSNK